MACDTPSPVHKLVDLLKQDDCFGQDKKDVKTPSNVKLPPLIDERVHTNPFTLPKEQSWVDLWKEYKLQDLNRRRAERKKKVHQKQTFTSRIAYSALPTIRQIHAADDEEQNEETTKEDYALRSRKCRLRPVEREFTHDFVRKKREIFLMEFALQTKRDEVEKHKTEALEQENKFARRIKRLHEDAVLFGEFLKATDDAAVERMKFAEKETRLKLEKAAEFRKLLGNAAALKSDISRKDDLLSKYFDCKAFLSRVGQRMMEKDSLPPESIASSQTISEGQRKASCRSQKHRKEMTDFKKRPSTTAKKTTRLAKTALTSNTDGAIVLTDSRQALSKIKYPKEWEENTGTSSQDGEASTQLPFESPQQLLDIIRDLEERNFKLIYKYQQTEEELQDIAKAANESKEEMNEQTNELYEHVKSVKKTIKKYDVRSDELSLMHAILSQGSREKDSKQALAELKGVVEKVYKAIFTQSIATMDALAMLNCIERRMDDLLVEVESHSVAAVQDVQRTIDKERRRQLREEKMGIQKLKQEERSKKAAERANAVSFKRTERRLMFRSMLPKTQGKKAKKLILRTKSQETIDFFSHD